MDLTHMEVTCTTGKGLCLCIRTSGEKASSSASLPLIVMAPMPSAER